MLSSKYRPQSFREMIGADIPREILMKIARNPQDCPTSIVLQGEWGSGKTTSARIFAKSLNCSSRSGDACNKCASCKAIDEGSYLYTEYDSGMVGHVDQMSEIRDTFSFSLDKGYRVVTLDESHLLSKSAQSLLLKTLEEVPQNIFFLWLSTDGQKMLPTIKSRSLILTYEPVPDSEILKLLLKVAKEEKIIAQESTLSLVARRAVGHVRDALQSLELLKLMGEEDYLKQNIFLDALIEKLYSSLKNEGKNYRDIVIQIVNYPVTYIDQDFCLFIKNLADKVYLTGKGDGKIGLEIVRYYLKYRRYLINTDHWYQFFYILFHSLVGETIQPTVVNKFQKK